MLSREQEEPEVAPVETLISSRLVVTGRAPGEEQLAGRCRTELARWSLSVLSLELTVARMRLINKILSGVTGSSQSRVKSSQAPPLEWHPVHGDNIRLSEGRSLASRREGFCRSVVFSQRPLQLGEKLWLRLVSVSQQGWRGGLRLGVSAVSPSQWTASSLPKYLCPDMTSRGGVWARAMPEKYAREGHVIFLCVKSTGQLVWGVNGKEKGVLVSGVDVSSPLWAVVDVYGSTNAVQLIDPRSSLANIMDRSSSLKEKQSRCGAKTITNEDILRQRRELVRGCLSQSCHGKNVSISDQGDIATRLETEFSNGYVFLDSPLQPGESLVVRVMETEATYIGSIAFGLTSADPRHLKSSELPEDSDLLSQRAEYWVHTKDVLSDPQDGDELTFSLSLDGAVLCSVNGGAQRLLFHTDISLPTRPFIDLYGVAQKIQIVGVHPSQPTATLRRSSRSNCSLKTRPKSCSPDPAMVQTECVICYESDVDCVLYSCGHMCMCFQCAVQQWSSAGECPLCRATIRDVIRTYRA